MKRRSFACSSTSVHYKYSYYSAMDIAVAAVGVVSAAGALHDLKAYTVECCHGAV